jgi:hypothetical protein
VKRSFDALGPVSRWPDRLRRGLCQVGRSLLPQTRPAPRLGRWVGASRETA